ncbi:MAG: PAS domain S-box protein [Methylobacter sp.]|nr:PAS domain S-box protein [Methylobacter sp.]
MRTTPLKNENLRIQKLHEYQILDTPSEQAFDDIVALAAQICGTPFALITLVDTDREWFKAKKGITVNENSRHGGFCAQTILHDDVMVVSNAYTDSRFSANALVTSEPNIHFYAGAPVRGITGEALGALCVLDTIPRELSAEQIEALKALARQVGTALELRRKEMSLAGTLAEAKNNDQLLHTTLNAYKEILNSANLSIISTDKQGLIVSFNRAAQCMLGYSEDDVVGKYLPTLFHDAGEIAARADILSDELNHTIAPGFEACIAKIYAGGADEREWTYIRKDGGHFPVRQSVTALHDVEGNITGFLKIAIDITLRKEAENRLKNSERFTRSVLDALSIQFCVLDKDGNILAINKPWLDFEYAYKLDASTQTLEVGQNYLALLEAGLAGNRGGEAFAEGIRSVLNGTTSGFSLEYPYRTQSMQQWYAGKVIPFPGQELGSVILIHENISDHKRLEHRFRQAVESAPNAIVMVNEEGTILMVNLQTEKSFGYSRAELVGQPVEILVPERFRGGHVSFRKAYLAVPVSRPMGAGRDLFGLRKDGTEFSIEIGLSLIENHEETIVLSSIVDITERKRLEHRFRQAVESAPNAIVMVNEEGTILMVNLQTEKSFGYSRAELVGQPVEILVPERFRGGHVSFRKAYLAVPVSRPMGAGRDLFGLRKDGTEFPVEIGLGLIDDENGTIVLSSIVDITERKNANDKLKDALNEKEMLLKEVYHRVKNNLQVVSSLINLQARNVTNESTADLLKQSADRIKAMALLHEKLYQSKDLARIDFNAYIHSLVDHLMFGYGAHSGKIDINLKIDDVFLDVDTAIPCGLIINELLSNAIKHAFPNDRHGEIGVIFTQNEGDFMLRITDNGIGFPPDLDFKKSASLGLQLVNTLTNQLMGRLTLDQANGSSFTIHFSNIS